jgi:hypothetical protein
MFAIRQRRKTVNEKDFLEAVNKVRIKAHPQPPAVRELCLLLCLNPPLTPHLPHQTAGYTDTPMPSLALQGEGG